MGSLKSTNRKIQLALPATCIFSGRREAFNYLQVSSSICTGQDLGFTIRNSDICLTGVHHQGRDFCQAGVHHQGSDFFLAADWGLGFTIWVATSTQAIKWY